MKEIQEYKELDKKRLSISSDSWDRKTKFVSITFKEAYTDNWLVDLESIFCYKTERVIDFSLALTKEETKTLIKFLQGIVDK